jgi:hypothetical protein
MVDSKRFQDWLGKATKDIDAARLLKQNNTFNDGCFSLSASY